MNLPDRAKELAREASKYKDTNILQREVERAMLTFGAECFDAASVAADPRTWDRTRKMAVELRKAMEDK